MTQLLKISTGNAKLKKRLIFSLPAGYTCPNAGVCKTFAGKQGGGIMDLSVPGDVPSYRCFAASQEAQYTNVRRARWHNYELLRAVSMDLPHHEAAEAMADSSSAASFTTTAALASMVMTCASMRVATSSTSPTSMHGSTSLTISPPVASMPTPSLLTYGFDIQNLSHLIYTSLLHTVGIWIA